MPVEVISIFRRFGFCKYIIVEKIKFQWQTILVTQNIIKVKNVYFTFNLEYIYM